MRCLSCNRGLSDQESVRKYASTGTFVDLCNRCFSTVAEEIADIDDGATDGIPSSEESGWEEENEGSDYQQFRQRNYGDNE